jgi:hypothetical protein
MNSVATVAYALSRVESVECTRHCRPCRQPSAGGRPGQSAASQHFHNGSDTLGLALALASTLSNALAPTLALALALALATALALVDEASSLALCTAARATSAAATTAMLWCVVVVAIGVAATAGSRAVVRSACSSSHTGLPVTAGRVRMMRGRCWRRRRRRRWSWPSTSRSRSSRWGHNHRDVQIDEFRVADVASVSGQRHVSSEIKIDNAGGTILKNVGTAKRSEPYNNGAGFQTFRPVLAKLA